MPRLSLIALLILLHSCVVFSELIYNHKKSYITQLTSINWEGQVNKIRQTTKQISFVQFYKPDDGKSKSFVSQMDEFTNDYRGLYRIGAVNCEEEPKICEKEKIKEFPTFRMFPPLPIPVIDYEGPLDTKKMLSFLAKYLQSNVIEVSSTNFDTFINDSPSVPKVLLFTEKAGVPMIYKGLSIAFDVYNGEIKFQPIFDFLNIFSEAFVPGGGSSQDSAATKHWLTEIVPEMYEKSAGDICLKIEGVLCLICLHEGKPTPKLIETFKSLHKLYDRKISRGSIFKFMWLDVNVEKEWTSLFKTYENKLPSVVILNPGRRKRYVLHEGKLDYDSLQSTLERINGGDAKFNLIKGDLPEFVQRKES